VFKHILLPTDGSPASDSAIDACIELARQTGASITALHAMPGPHMYTYEPGVTEAVNQQIRNERHLHSKKYLDIVEQRAAAAGVPCKTILATADAPYEAIIDAARDGDCDLIAMASHGRRGIKALLLGSETQKVLAHSAIPVLVFRDPAAPPPPRAALTSTDPEASFAGL